MTNEETLIRRIKELTKVDNLYRKKSERLEAKRVKLIHKLEEERKVFNKEWQEEVKNLNPSIKELWLLQASTGVHTNVYDNEIPQIVKSDYYTIKEKITGGCTGNWYDGCRGCEKNCHQRARQEWKKKYGIVNIDYGNYIHKDYSKS